MKNGTRQEVTRPLVDLDTITLDRGDHTRRDQGMCFMEAVSWWQGLDHTDAPPCVSGVLRQFGIDLNDGCDHDRRQKLKQYIPRLPGTAHDGHDNARTHLVLDWLIRTAVTAWLDLAGLNESSTALRDLAPIVDADTAGKAGPLMEQARWKACDAEQASEGLGVYALADRADGGVAVGTRHLTHDFIPGSWSAAGTGHSHLIIEQSALLVSRRDPAAVERTIGEVQDSAIDLFGRMISVGGAR